jgi:uncharacterized protein YneF (UPF0154 family)
MGTKPYLIAGIIFLIIPLIVFIIYGNIFQSYESCETSTSQECINNRTLIIIIPLSLILGFASFIYASMKQLRKK